MRVFWYHNDRRGRFRLPPNRMRRQRRRTARLRAHAAEVRRIRELMKSTPDVRQDKVEEMKKQIESGEYNITAQAVADSIVEHHTKLNRKDKS